MATDSLYWMACWLTLQHSNRPSGSQTPVPAESTHSVWPRILAIIAFFAGFEGILFHTGLYSSIVEPDSTTGYMELQLRNEIRRPKPNRNQVLAVGHSRMALLPRVVNEQTPGTGYTFATIGLGGTTPRIWYYALRAVDPNAHNYAAIVIPEDDYNEPDGYDYQSERETDLHYLLARLELRDLLDFPWTFQSKKLRWQIVRGMILKGSVYKRDFLEFIAHPAARVKKARYFASDSAGWYYGYGGVDENLTGLKSIGSIERFNIPPVFPRTGAKISKMNCFPIFRPTRGAKPRICVIGMDGSSITTAGPAPSSSLCACRARRCPRPTLRPNSTALYGRSRPSRM